MGEKRWKNVRQVDLLRALEITLGKLEDLAHHAELNVLGVKNAANLPKHLFHPYIGSGIPRTVVSREKQLQFLSGLPGLAFAQHPAQFLRLDDAAHPGFQHE